ncbi:hypothetical protein [Streptomyces sp. NPDC018693]|uniref:hypothetical protein n=1 Tax=unclassified Streptomyces TaxID=2593676 RepID=UPI0037927B5C
MHMRKRVVGTAVAALAAGTLAWFGTTGATVTAQGTEQGTVTSVADEAPGYTVENFNYPQADKILAEHGITLKRGDGHITLADCVSGTGQLEIMARSHTDNICFNVTGNSGWLTLEIPTVFAIRGNDYTTQVDMTTGAEEKSFDIVKNSWTAVGESADEQGRDFMLVEIRTSK